MTKDDVTTMTIGKWFVCNGDLLRGHTFYGVFDTIEDAFAWGTDNFEVSGFYVAELKPKEEIENA